MINTAPESRKVAMTAASPCRSGALAAISHPCKHHDIGPGRPSYNNVEAAIPCRSGALAAIAHPCKHHGIGPRTTINAAYRPESSFLKPLQNF